MRSIERRDGQLPWRSRCPVSTGERQQRVDLHRSDTRTQRRKAASQSEQPDSCRSRPSLAGHLLPLDSAERATPVQRLLSVGRERRVRGVGHIAIIEVHDVVPVDRPVLSVLLTFKG
jgi:hypothetical protein